MGSYNKREELENGGPDDQEWDASRLNQIVEEFAALDPRDAEQSLLALKLIAEMVVRGYKTAFGKGSQEIVRNPETAIRAIQAMADVRAKMPKAPPVFIVEVNLTHGEGDNDKF